MWDLENNLICELLNIWNETSQIEWNGYRTFIWSTRTNLGLRYSLFAVWLRWSSLSECDLLGCMIVSSREVVLASFYLLSPLGLLSLAWDGVWLSANAISFFHRYVLLELWGKHESLFHSLKDKGVVGRPLESLLCAIHVDLPVHSKLNWLYYLIIYDKRL